MDLEELIRLLMSRGVDVEDVLLDALSIKDPEESAKERIGLAEKYVNEARDYLSRVMRFRLVGRLTRLLKR